MNHWLLATELFIALSVLTLIPTILAIIKRVKLHPGGDSFNESLYFTDGNKQVLKQHYSRIQGTLIFWKNQAEKFKHFHYYCLSWTIPTSILIPIITQYINHDPYSKLLLTVISTHTALVLAFHRGFKVDKNFKAFRHGESEFYDTYRRLLDRPESFGNTQEEQIDRYFQEVEAIRKAVRNSETDNLPNIEEIKTTMTPK